jgi:hypothetical protein
MTMFIARKYLGWHPDACPRGARLGGLSPSDISVRVGQEGHRECKARTIKPLICAKEVKLEISG